LRPGLSRCPDRSGHCFAPTSGRFAEWTRNSFVVQFTRLTLNERPAGGMVALWWNGSDRCSSLIAILPCIHSRKPISTSYRRLSGYCRTVSQFTKLGCQGRSRGLSDERNLVIARRPHFVFAHFFLLIYYSLFHNPVALADRH